MTYSRCPPIIQRLLTRQSLQLLPQIRPWCARADPHKETRPSPIYTPHRSLSRQRKSQLRPASAGADTTETMKLALFSTKPYDRKYFDAALSDLKDASSSDAEKDIEPIYFDATLDADTVSLIKQEDGIGAVCAFVNDTLNGEVLEALSSQGVKAILMRCAGYNNVDLDTASRLGLFVANVPSYSPEAVAEFAVGLLQTLNRKIHRAYNRTREGNFNLDGLLGRTLYGKTVGVIGTGRIGLGFARIMKGFGCKLLAYDAYPNKAFEEELEGTFVASVDELLPQCDVISLHCPLMDSTRHLINAETLRLVKKGALLVNTSRGGLVDTKHLIEALKNRRLGGVALDVYEAESGLFFSDHSGHVIDDDVISRLMTFPNVLVCGHQGFFTEEALHEIADCTLRNLQDFVLQKECKHLLIKQEDQTQRPDGSKGQREPVRTV